MFTIIANYKNFFLAFIKNEFSAEKFGGDDLSDLKDLKELTTDKLTKKEVEQINTALSDGKIEANGEAMNGLKEVAASMLSEGFSAKDKNSYESFKKLIEKSSQKIPEWNDLVKKIDGSKIFVADFINFNGIKIKNNSISIIYGDKVLPIKHNKGNIIDDNYNLVNLTTKTNIDNIADVKRDILDDNINGIIEKDLRKLAKNIEEYVSKIKDLGEINRIIDQIDNGNIDEFSDDINKMNIQLNENPVTIKGTEIKKVDFTTYKEILEKNKRLITVEKPFRYIGIVDYLNSKNIDSSRAHRKQLAIENGIENYRGTAAQNILLLKKLQNSTVEPKPVVEEAPVVKKAPVVEEAPFVEKAPVNTEISIEHNEVTSNGINTIDKEISDKYTPYIYNGVEYLINTDYVKSLNVEVLGQEIKEGFDELSDSQKSRIFKLLQKEGKIVTLKDYVDKKNGDNDIKVQVWQKGTEDLEDTDIDINKGEDVLDTLEEDEYDTSEVIKNIAGEILDADTINTKIGILGKAMGIDFENPSDETKQLLVKIGNKLGVFNTNDVSIKNINVKTTLKNIIREIGDNNEGYEIIKTLINPDGKSDFSINDKGFAFDGRNLKDGQILTGKFNEESNDSGKEKDISMAVNEINVSEIPKELTNEIKEGETISLGDIDSNLNGIFLTKRAGKIFSLGEVADNSSTSLGIYGDTKNVDWEKIITHVAIIGLAEALWSFSGDISGFLDKIRPELKSLKMSTFNFEDLKIGSVALGTFAAGAVSGLTLGVFLTRMYYSRERDIAELATNNQIIKTMMIKGSENIKFEEVENKVKYTSLQSYESSSNDKNDGVIIYYPTLEIAEMEIGDTDLQINELGLKDEKVSPENTLITIDGKSKMLNEVESDLQNAIIKSIESGEVSEFNKQEEVKEEVKEENKKHSDAYNNFIKNLF